jgi:iron complex outermembrane receptor protein
MTSMHARVAYAPMGLLLLFAAPALAQVSDPANSVATDVAKPSPQAATDATSPDPADIIVTALKQASPLSRTPAAVSAITADQLAPGGVQNIADLQTVVPNVSIGDQFGVNRTFIRGVGLNNFDIGGEGAVAFLQNGAILARPAQQLSGFFDLEQIEVLRGPQSILYGRGATAGAINMVTTRPTAEFSGYVRATYGNYDSKILEGAVGGGVIGDTLLVRVAGKYEKRDGYGKNLFTGEPVDNRDAYALRGTAILNVTPSLQGTLVVDHFREDDNNYAFHYFGPSVVPDNQLPNRLIGGKTIFDYYAARSEEPNLRNIYSDQEAINYRKGTGVTGTVDWSNDALSVKSITAYREFRRFQRDDLDVSDVWLAGRNDYTERSKTFSQEVTLNYTGDRLSVLAGAMYFHERLDGIVSVPTINLGVLFGLPANIFDDGAYEQNGTVYIDAVGAYLQAGYDITDTLKLTLGARYNYEHRKGEGSFRFDAIGVLIPTDESKGWPAVTPKALIEYKPNERSLFYASVTKGFKSGVINVGSVDAAIDPETVWSYEAGFKQKFAGGRMLLSGAAFYYDYTNLQVSFVNATNIVQTINAASARNFGGELEFEGRVARNLSLNLNASYLNAKFKEFCNAYYGAAFPARPGISYEPCAGQPGLVDLSGKRLPNAPRFSVGGGFDLDVPLTGDTKLTWSGDAKYQTKVYFTEFNNRDAEQDGYALANSALTFHGRDDRYTVGVWVKNLTDKFVIANNIIAAGTFAYVRVGSLLPPRTFGGTVAFKF